MTHRVRLPGLGVGGLRSLQHRNFRLFFLGQVISVSGTWMQTVALGWLVLDLTGEPLLLGVVAAAQFGPVLALGLFGGLIADVLPKRRTLVATQVLAMVLALMLFVLSATGTVEVWQIIALALALGLTSAVEMPTRQSFVFEMVGREDVVNAVALNSAVFNGARIVGPAIAGILIGVFDISIAFLANGLSYLAAITVLVMMREGDLYAPPRMPWPRSLRAIGANLAEGLAYIRRTDLVALAILSLGASATFGMNFTVITPPLARDVLGSDATGYGFLMAASGVGAVMAAIVLAIRGHRPWAIGGGFILLGLFEVVLAVSRVFALSLLAMLLVGFGAILAAATVNTTIQLAVPDQLRGRVMSVYTTVFAGSTPIGGLIMGAIGSGFGIAVAIGVGGAITAVVGLTTAVVLRRIQRTEARLAGKGAAAEPSLSPVDVAAAPPNGRRTAIRAAGPGTDGGSPASSSSARSAR